MIGTASTRKATMIGHDDGPADSLLHPRQRILGKLDGLLPSKNPRMASLFLLVPCLLLVVIYNSRPLASSWATLAVAAGHAAWPERAYGVSLGGCTLPHVEPNQNVLPWRMCSRVPPLRPRNRRARDGDQPVDQGRRRASRPAAAVDVRPDRGGERARLRHRTAPQARRRLRYPDDEEPLGRLLHWADA